MGTPLVLLAHDLNLDRIGLGVALRNGEILDGSRPERNGEPNKKDRFHNGHANFKGLAAFRKRNRAKR